MKTTLVPWLLLLFVIGVASGVNRLNSKYTRPQSVSFYPIYGNLEPKPNIGLSKFGAKLEQTTVAGKHQDESLEKTKPLIKLIPGDGDKDSKVPAGESTGADDDQGSNDIDQFWAMIKQIEKEEGVLEIGPVREIPNYVPNVLDGKPSIEPSNPGVVPNDTDSGDQVDANVSPSIASSIPQEKPQPAGIPSIVPILSNKTEARPDPEVAVEAPDAVPGQELPIRPTPAKPVIISIAEQKPIVKPDSGLPSDVAPALPIEPPIFKFPDVISVPEVPTPVDPKKNLPEDSGPEDPKEPTLPDVSIPEDSNEEAVPEDSIPGDPLEEPPQVPVPEAPKEPVPDFPILKPSDQPQVPLVPDIPQETKPQIPIPETPEEPEPSPGISPTDSQNSSENAEPSKHNNGPESIAPILTIIFLCCLCLFPGSSLLSAY